MMRLGMSVQLPRVHCRITAGIAPVKGDFKPRAVAPASCHVDVNADTNKKKKEREKKLVCRAHDKDASANARGKC